MEGTESDKQSSLLGYKIKYGFKKLYCTAPMAYQIKKFLNLDDAVTK
jgi:hypothetical protein